MIITAKEKTENRATDAEENAAIHQATYKGDFFSYLIRCADEARCAAVTTVSRQKCKN
jgi:hypothetical protein